MKFPTFREYRASTTNVDQIAKYLSVDLVRSLRELTLGLTKLSFPDNFAGWVTEVELAAGEQVTLDNPLREIPNYRLVLRGGEGAQNIVDGDSVWTTTTVSLKNSGGVAVRATVAFMK